jgi:hypothetical protein
MNDVPFASGVHHWSSKIIKICGFICDIPYLAGKRLRALMLPTVYAIADRLTEPQKQC